MINTPDNNNAIASNSKGATFLMLTQVFSKLLTFLLNQLLVRLVSPTLFGISAYLEFLYSAILFFSREAERLSIQRTSGNKDIKQTYQSILNFAWIPLIIGFPLSCVIFYWQFKSEIFHQAISISTTEYFIRTVVLIWSLIIIELCTEPLYAISQYDLNFAKRSKYEGIAIFLRCIVTLGVIYLIDQNVSVQVRNGKILWAFGLGQIVYSQTLFMCYLQKYFYENNTFNYLPSKFEEKENKRYFDTNVVSFWKISFIQMIFKQILTEGDRLLISGFFSVEETGIFSVVTNYGSIIARLLFQPIEESFRLSFTKGLSSSQSKKNHVQNAVGSIRILMMLYFQLSILIILAGFINAPYLLRILLGGKTSAWEDTDLFHVFQYYVLYIPFLAFNGILEAFFSSAANTIETRNYSYFMSFLSVFMIFLLYIFIGKWRMGIMGLILANSVNMLIRIIYCATFIDSFLSQNDININYCKILKFLGTNTFIGIMSLAANYYILGYTWTSTSILDLVKSGSICVGCLTLMLTTITQELKLVITLFKGKLNR